ncbi:MAG TPA: DinB family protein [Bacillota bacterium]|nr:DinB family protein [Bacillota bacterium]
MSRMSTMSNLKRLDEAQWDMQPPGFNNTIRWNAGHNFVIVETFLAPEIEGYEIVHPEWVPLFEDGTRPADWGDDVEIPTSDEIRSALREQVNRLSDQLGDRDVKLSKPLVIGDNVLEIETLEGMIQFLSWHEGTHAGIINALSKITATMVK